jgi:hypothetical protein
VLNSKLALVLGPTIRILAGLASHCQAMGSDNGLAAGCSNSPCLAQLPKTAPSGHAGRPFHDRPRLSLPVVSCKEYVFDMPKHTKLESRLFC